jgi:hypothetical protein
MAQDFVPDQAPLEPPHTRDLQKYILTLPVFEMAPKDERIHWVTSNAVRTNTENSFVIIGDGAQSSVTLERLSAITEPSQRIRVTVEAQGGGGDPVYDLERVQGGWRHLAGPVRKSNKSWMATANSSSASPSAHLNRAVPSH